MQAYFTAQATFTASSPSLLGTAAEKGKVGVARMSFFSRSFSLSFGPKRQLRLEQFCCSPSQPQSAPQPLHLFRFDGTAPRMPHLHSQKRDEFCSFCRGSKISLSAEMYLLKSCSVKK
jgi:hypothetical protein